MATVEEKAMQDAAASVDTAYTLSVGDGFQGNVEGRSDVDWVKVELVAGQSYDVRLQGIGPDGLIDTVLRIYNSAGEQLAHNDDIDTSRGERDSMLEFSPDTTGVYYISASGFGAETGNYVVTLFDEEDNNPDTPYTVSAGGRFNGTLDSKFDEDWVRVELVEGKTYSISLNGIGPDADTDTILRLYNSAGEQVAFHDDVDYAAGKVNSLLMFSPAATGTYYISAGAYRGNPTQDNSGRYQVAVYDRDGHVLIGTEGNDRGYSNDLIGGPGDDELDGKAGNDWLEGGGGADMLRGGAGVDAARYLYSDAGVEVRLYDGTARGGDAEGDTFAGVQTIEYLDADGVTREVEVPDIEYLYGSNYDDILVGAHGRNILYGLSGNDELDGREGNDVLLGGPGNDELRGGPGIDIASYFTSGAGVEVRLYDGTARGGDAEGDTFAGVQTIEYLDADGETREMEVPDIESLYGSNYDDILVGAHGGNRLTGGAGNDELDGREGNDRLYGGAGNDELDGREGNDRLYGGAGADMLRGGDGLDWAIYFSSDAGVEVRLDDGTARGGDAEGDTFAGVQIIEFLDADGTTREVEVPDIENLAGSGYDDILVGAHGDNNLQGYLGNDELDGREGDDQLFGGAGNDELDGGEGDDQLEGGPGNDALDGREGNDLLFGDAGNDELDGGEGDDSLDGGAGNDALDGREGNDLLFGDAGNDELDGGEGDDYLDGGAGNDALDGREGNDLLYGSAGNDELDGGEGDDLLYGDAGNDELDGGEGDDYLEGGAGADVLRGGPGNDSLHGGVGDDVFFFAPGGGDDTVLDFGVGEDEDKVDLTAFADVQSIEDLVMEQQESTLVIDLSGQGGGTVTLENLNEADVMEAYFIFFTDAEMGMA